jgi:hypothetical protein
MDDTLVQVLSPIATVTAAIITGFLVAVFKHRWDSEADEKRWRKEREADEQRWQKERKDGILALRLDAFAVYLTARPDESAVGSLFSHPEDYPAVIRPAQLAAAKLLILLSDPAQREVVNEDLARVVDFAQSWVSSRANRKRLPDVEPVLGLARVLVAESGDFTPTSISLRVK